MSSVLENFSRDAMVWLASVGNWPEEAVGVVQDRDGTVMFYKNDIAPTCKSPNEDWVSPNTDKYVNWVLGSTRIFKPNDRWEKAHIRRSQMRRCSQPPTPIRPGLRHFSPWAGEFLSEKANWPVGAVGVCQDHYGLKFYRGETPLFKGGWRRGANKNGCYVRDGDGNKIMRIGETPDDSSLAIARREEVFGGGPVVVVSGPLRHFSESGRVYLASRDNWPKNAAWAMQDGTGHVKFSQAEGDNKYDTNFWSVPIPAEFREVDVGDTPEDWKLCMVSTEEVFGVDLVLNNQADYSDQEARIVAYLVSREGGEMIKRVIARGDDGGVFQQIAERESVSKQTVKNMFIKVTRSTPGLEHFSEEGRAYVTDAGNWPDETVGVCQCASGCLIFYEKGGVVWDGKKGWGWCLDILHTPIKTISLKDSPKYPWLANTLRKDVSPTGESDEPPTLRRDGRWWPTYGKFFPVPRDVGGSQFEFDRCGLSVKSVAPDDMVVMIMRKFGEDRLAATSFHNDHVDIGHALTVSHQRYEWRLD